MRIAILIALLSSSLAGMAQNLSSQLDQVIALVSPEVQIGKDVVKQSLTYQPDAPYRVTLKVTEIDRRGRMEDIEYEVNLAMISPREVGYEDGRDQIRVILGSDGPVVKVIEDGELEDYEDELVIQALNIDNARALEDRLKKIVPMAQEDWERDHVLPEDFDGLKRWVAEHIASPDLGDEGYEQRWEADPESEQRVVFYQDEIDGGDRTERIFRFDLADLNPSSIHMDVKGEEVMVELRSTDRKDFIQVVEDGVLEDYQDEFTIYCMNPDGGQLLSYALRKLPLLADERTIPLPQPNSRISALSSLKEAVQSFSYGDFKVSQQMEGNCSARYALEVDDDGDVETEVFEVDLSDLAAQTAEIEIKGTDVWVEIETRDGRDFIYHEEDGEQENYEDELQVYAKDIPNAKRLLHFMKLAVEACPNGVAPSNYSTIQQIIQDTRSDELRQELEQLEGEPCKWAFTQIEDEGRSRSENRYEFNLYDIAADRLEIDVRGKEIEIEISTRRGEEIIKAYRDGEEQGYEEDFEILLPDVASAKLVEATLKEMIEVCEAEKPE